MARASVTNREFKGVRIEIETEIPFEEVLGALRAQTGRTTVAEIGAVASAASSVEDFHKDVNKRFVGPGGFMIFAEIDHGEWIARYGIHRRVLRVILGNPLIAITMLREDISAGLFAPVEILLADKADGSGSMLQYVRPSSLIAIDGNAALASAARELDRKLDLLLSNITGLNAGATPQEKAAAQK
jgi:uncharacterized protein (DUF302 family)